jgi:hypothetical protein
MGNALVVEVVVGAVKPNEGVGAVVEVVVGAVNPKEVAGAVVGGVVETVMGQTFLIFLWLCLAGDWW